MRLPLQWRRRVAAPPALTREHAEAGRTMAWSPTRRRYCVTEDYSKIFFGAPTSLHIAVLGAGPGSRG